MTLKDTSRTLSRHHKDERIDFTRTCELEDIANLMLLPAGRRFLARILDLCACSKPLLGSEQDMAIAEGKRRIGFIIEQDIKEKFSAQELGKIYDEQTRQNK